MLMNMKDLLAVAQKNHFAIPAFNIGSDQLLKVVMNKVKELNSPVILEMSPDEFNFVGDAQIQAMIYEAAQTDVPVCIHLDHGDSYETAVRAIRAGMTSVMIDASTLPYEENVRLTKEVTDLAHMVGVSVEGEIGTIGVMSNSDEGGVENVTYTNPEDVIDFVTKTGVDCLAIAIGTAHGIYPKGFVPKLQLELLERIKEVAPVPLVLHGGSNNPDDEIRRACQIGIRKVNISSDFKYAFFKKVDEVIQETGGFVPAKVLTPGINDAKQVIREKMELFGSLGKAELYR